MVSLKSAKGAARTTKQASNCFAPRSVLRVFLKTRTAPRAGPCAEEQPEWMY